MTKSTFDPRPEQWGLRGDPYLWEEMERCYDLPAHASLSQIQAHLTALFSALTASSMESDAPIEVERYAHGGMSSGMVSPHFWRNVAQPLLLQQSCRGTALSVFCWNLNNRVGRMPFRPEAVNAALTVGADVLVFTEFFPQGHLDDFQRELRASGWGHQVLSQEAEVKANRILVASRLPLVARELPPTAVDEHLVSNTLRVQVGGVLELLCSRVPTYTGQKRANAWDWLAGVASHVRAAGPALLIGDLNTGMAAKLPVPQFKSLLGHWRRWQPLGRGSYLGPNGVTSEIDHALTAGQVDAAAWYVRNTVDHQLADSSDAISDHTGLYVQLDL